MILLYKEQSCLLELIKTSLFDLTPVIPDNVNWEKVFEFAKSQCIVPLIASCVPEEYRNEWLGIAYQSKAYYMQLLFSQNSLVNLLKNNKIPYIILKGTAAAIYYPSPTMRTYGDIDFYISESQASVAKNLLQENGYLYLSSDGRHHEFEKNGIDFELHYQFSCQSYNCIDHFVLNGLNNAVEYKITNSSFCGLPTYENGLVLLGHIMQHIKASGIGLRQIIDWMMFVHEELDDSAWYDHFRLLAHEAGLEKLAITVTFMCKKWLGLPNEIVWCNTADEEVADQLMFRILDDGNFGHYRTSSEKVKKSLNDEGTFRYLQRAGMINWPLAQKCALFRPFAWLYQLCRYAIKGTASLFTGKKGFINMQGKMSLEELWKRLE